MLVDIARSHLGFGLRVVRIALAFGREEAGEVPAGGRQPKKLLGACFEGEGADEVGGESLQEVRAGYELGHAHGRYVMRE
ncbi:MAG TPA: hypothetical protein VNB06_19295 [Thermoanaerobaculia bacterium]|nr:hypothetical protein [Thermoanaerobaculia bacterium]